MKDEFGSVMSCVCAAFKWKQFQTGFPNGSGTNIRLLSTFHWAAGPTCIMKENKCIFLEKNSEKNKL